MKDSIQSIKQKVLKLTEIAKQVIRLDDLDDELMRSAFSLWSTMSDKDDELADSYFRNYNTHLYDLFTTIDNVEHFEGDDERHFSLSEFMRLRSLIESIIEEFEKLLIHIETVDDSDSIIPTLESYEDDAIIAYTEAVYDNLLRAARSHHPHFKRLAKLGEMLYLLYGEHVEPELLFLTKITPEYKIKLRKYLTSDEYKN